VDFYEILQVDRRADHDVIRAAYRVLARRHHPDHGGNPQRMAAVNQAWATLGDPALRARYDAASRRANAAAAVVAEAAATAGGASTRNGSRTPAAADRVVGVMQTEVPTYRPVPPPATREPGPGVLDFGRYAGWTVTELSRHDPDYLLWLERTPIGRPLRSEIQRAMELRRAPIATATTAAAGAGRSAGATKGRLFGRF
jgi:curved DNA-binding protein CbpA